MRAGGGVLSEPHRRLSCSTERSRERLEALPYDRDNTGRVLVAVADPLNEAKHAEIEASVGTTVGLALAERERLKAAIAVAYGSSSGTTGANTEPLGKTVGSDHDQPHINDLLIRLVELGGSDLHVTAGSPPQARVNGDLQPMEEFGKLLPAPLRAMIYEILTNRQKEELEDNRELDCSHPLTGKGRFRVNVFFQRDSIGAVMRAIPSEIVPLPKLGMPAGACRVRSPPAWPGARHRSDRVRQVDDAGIADRPHQHDSGCPHHDDRGPDRVHAPPQVLHREPTRGRRRHAVRSPRPSSTHFVRTPT